jgi:hypothetical protein
MCSPGTAVMPALWTRYRSGSGSSGSRTSRKIRGSNHRQARHRVLTEAKVPGLWSQWDAVRLLAHPMKSARTTSSTPSDPGRLHVEVVPTRSGPGRSVTEPSAGAAGSFKVVTNIPSCIVTSSWRANTPNGNVAPTIAATRRKYSRKVARFPE